jgi:hypothetical protein
MRVRDARTDGHGGGRGWLTELQGVTVDFLGCPQLHLWPQRRPAAPLARMYREQLGRNRRGL